MPEREREATQGDLLHVLTTAIIAVPIGPAPPDTTLHITLKMSFASAHVRKRLTPEVDASLTTCRINPPSLRQPRPLPLPASLMAYDFVLWRQRSSEGPAGSTSGCRMLPRALTCMSAASSLEGFRAPPRNETPQSSAERVCLFIYFCFVARQAAQNKQLLISGISYSGGRQAPRRSAAPDGGVQAAAFFFFSFCFLITPRRSRRLFND